MSRWEQVTTAALVNEIDLQIADLREHAKGEGAWVNAASWDSVRRLVVRRTHIQNLAKASLGRMAGKKEELPA